VSSPFVGGKAYSIADMAIWPWLRNWKNQGIELGDFPHVKAWFELIEKRPAVQKAVQVLAAQRKPLTDDKQRDDFVWQYPVPEALK
jgi:GSH-dependent disulfide-bond oxidoreductase